jgi:hypothetical protein
MQQKVSSEMKAKSIIRGFSINSQGTIKIIIWGDISGEEETNCGGD